VRVTSAGKRDSIERDDHHQNNENNTVDNNRYEKSSIDKWKVRNAIDSHNPQLTSRLFLCKKEQEALLLKAIDEANKELDLEPPIQRVSSSTYKLSLEQYSPYLLLKVWTLQSQ